MLFWQHPFGQLVGVHTQLPLEHVVPVGQAPQVTPLLPQAAFVLPARHWLFWQQPAQLAAVHTHEPFWHVVPAAHWMQATPLLPQAALVVPALQVWVAVSQQPFAQLAAVHTHEPF